MNEEYMDPQIADYEDTVLYSLMMQEVSDQRDEIEPDEPF